MPTDEDGDKWACEPCIRGHRSTRCEHWDRFMLRVKKPGRPLSSCPHPKSNCGCGREKIMMVRIAKDSTCVCRPAFSLGRDGRPVPLNPESSSEFPPNSSNPNAFPVSMNSNTQGPYNPTQYRVNKARKRSGSFADPQVIARALDGGQYAIHGGVSLSDEYHTTGPVENHGESNSTISLGAAPPMFFNSGDVSTHTSIPTYMQPTQSAAGLFYQYPMSLDDSIMNNMPMHEQSSDEAGVIANAPFIHARHDNPTEVFSHSINSVTGNSCCYPNPDNDSIPSLGARRDSGSKVERTEVEHQNHQICQERGHLAVSQGSFDPRVQGISSPEYSQYSQNPVPAIGNGSCITYSEPYLAANSASDAKQAPYEWQMSRHSMQALPPFDYRRMTDSNGVPLELGNLGNSAHSCNCGDDCHCLGCAAHPYNDATMNHVKKLNQMMADDHDSESLKSLPESPIMNDYTMSQAVTSLNSTPALPTIETDGHSTNHFDQQETHFINDDFLEQSEPSEHVFTSADFYEMRFPVETSETQYNECSDTVGSCFCGDDCICIGCIKHAGHTGNSLQDGTPEDTTQLDKPSKKSDEILQRTSHL